MADPIAVTNLALSLLSKTSEALNALRERSKTSKDTDLKAQISAMYDHVNDLKEAVSRLTEENRELKNENGVLKKQLNEKPLKPTVRQVGDTNYVVVGDKGPYCQVCHAKDGKLVDLLPLQPWNGGKRRECPVCGEFFYEQRMNTKSSRLGSRHGSHGWMG